MPYKYHVDPGHGWIEVKFQEIVDLGIQDKISSCSYIYNNVCYLEEDCDAPVWYQAYLAKHQAEPEVVEVYHNHECFVREYHPFVWTV